MRRFGIGIIGLALMTGLPALAVTVEVPPELQGRRNPYRPLIGTPHFPEGAGSDPVPVRKPASALERLEYVGIAYDEAEAIAAVSDGERTWFVRAGDRLEGATVTSITPHKLTWNRNGRLIVKHLRREGVR
jgi:YD repeat-containing protein